MSVDDLACFAVGQLAQAQPVDTVVLGLSLHHGLPLPVQRLDDVDGKGGVLGLAVEGELIFGLAVRNFVDFEPLNGCCQKTCNKKTQFLISNWLVKIKLKSQWWH